MKSLTVLLDVKVGPSSEEQKTRTEIHTIQSQLGIHNIARKGKVYYH